MNPNREKKRSNIPQAVPIILFVTCHSVAYPVIFKIRVLTDFLGLCFFLSHASATGAVYDVECRDTKTGDGAFLAVTPSLSGDSFADVKDQFLIKSLFGPRGRFSFYGQPTDVKVKKSTLSADGSYRVLDVNFSTLSQATQSEVPRKSRIVATLPKGSDQVVMLVGSSSATRWSKGSEKTVGAAVDSFRATAAPQTNLKLRAVSKDRFEL